MSLRDLLPAIRAAGGYKALTGRSLSISEILRPIFLAARYDDNPRTTLIIAPDRTTADATAADLASILGLEVHVLPAHGDAGGDDGDDPESTGLRAAAFDSLVSDPEALVVATARAAAEPLSKPVKNKRLASLIALGDTRGPDTLIETLGAYGYERAYEVQNKGEFAVRGGILDIYGSGASNPVRLEFDGDEVASMRSFSLVDQISTGPVESAIIYPVRTAAGEGAALFDYLPKGASVFLVEPEGLPDDVEIPSPPGATIISSLAAGRPALEIERHPAFLGDGRGVDFNHIQGYLKSLRDRDLRIVAVLADRGRADRFAELLREWEMAAGVEVREGAVRTGFILSEAGLALLTEADLFGAKRELRQTRQTKSRAFFDLMDLQEGDYVVHIYHGIGRYAGLTQRQVDGLRRDYILLEYAQRDKLYIPTDQLGLIQRYIGGEGTAPAVDRLGSKRWYNVKRKVKESTARIAAELVELYAARKSAEGHAFAPDTPWQRELEESFPFIETPDQERAIDGVKMDMEDPHPMDRLICGDVGYGKTEVAVRAAFKAVMDGRQAAILAPTTLLAEQHYETFRERFEPFPIGVAQLSRLKKPSEQAKTIEGLKDGTVDVVIGTHRLLQADVKFKNLGLFVIDEEQRFGVRHKEFLKKLRLNVDVITLSATPIPRTLNMALTGARDMSVIDTPPEDRFPVATFVKPYDDAVIAAAVQRELSRQGQAFFVHNRVDSIEYAAERVRRLVPGARVAVSHGQMGERQLELVMSEFQERRYDVLVATTIIESGLDMPNVNTLIVDRADKLGLSQLYQLRGRVGRSDRRAYAFFLIPPELSLSPTQLRRLKTIAEFTDLGSGFRVALRDLEIRGAGNVLGAEQHGFINEVGFELYASLLQDAVAGLKGEPVRKHVEVKINLPVEAYIPKSYIGQEPLRIDAYKKIAQVAEEDDVGRLRKEFRDRFGHLPEIVENLLLIAKLKATAGRAGVNRVTAERGRVRLSPIDVSAGLDGVLRKYSDLAKYKQGERALYVVAPRGRAGVVLLDQLLCDIMTHVF
ncbi:MAG: transcription-repair coupling factor [Actinomycetota bacterium]